MPHGVFRRVVLFGRFALKFPRIARLTQGMRCNRWEREMWGVWRPIFGWQNLCPILFADALGLLVVMPRAAQPVSFEEVVEATPDHYPEITSETKAADFGRVNGRVLALDYGIWDQEDVVDRRHYYREKAHLFH